MEQRELFDRFVDTTLPADQFHHQQHVQVAWLFVRKHGMPAALSEFSMAIKRFADAKGATGLYHETITWAFLLLIADRQARRPAETWPLFEAAIRSPDVEAVDSGAVLFEGIAGVRPGEADVPDAGPGLEGLRVCRTSRPQALRTSMT